jgi:hypothetical protein
MHYSAGMSIFVPTGNYDTAQVTLDPPTVKALNTGKNVWSFQPSFSMTYLNTDNGREASGAMTLLFSEENSETNYQTAPAFTLETALMQHLPSGWALGVSGYWYEQLGDDSGLGAVLTRTALGATSLSAQTLGAGPLATYNGEFLGLSTSFKFKYISEFGANRRFENDMFWLNATIAF